MRWLTPVALAVPLLLGACATLPDGPVPAEVLYADVQCGTEGAAARVGLVGDDAALATLRARLGAITLGGASLPRIDFARHHAVLAEMGQRPTGGYGLALIDATVEQRVLTLRVAWQEASPDGVQTQALTSPCLLVRVPAADYRGVKLRDAQGRLRAVQ